LAERKFPKDFKIHWYSLAFLNEAREIAINPKPDRARLNYIFSRLLPNANTIPNGFIRKGRGNMAEYIEQAIELLKSRRYKRKKTGYVGKSLKNHYFNCLIKACPLELKDRKAYEVKRLRRKS